MVRRQIASKISVCKVLVCRIDTRTGASDLLVIFGPLRTQRETDSNRFNLE